MSVTAVRRGHDRSVVEASILIPTWNRANVLDECLASLCEVTPDVGVEIIVIDNGSEDHTPEVLDRWVRLDGRIKSRREPHLGRSRALNAGLELARGRIVLFTDDDVIVQPGWVEAYQRFFAEQPDEFTLVGGPIIPIPNDLGAWPAWLGTEPAATAGGLHHGATCRPLAETEWLWGANMAMATATIHALGGWEESLGVQGRERGTYEDIEIQERVLGAGGIVWFLPDAVIHHRVRRSSVTPRSVLVRSFHGGLSTSTQALHRREDRDQIPSTVTAITVLCLGILLLVPVAGACRIRRTASLIRLGRWSARSVGDQLGVLEFARDTAAVSRPMRGTIKVARWLAWRAVRLAPAS